MEGEGGLVGGGVVVRVERREVGRGLSCRVKRPVPRLKPTTTVTSSTTSRGTRSNIVEEETEAAKARGAPTPSVAAVGAARRGRQHHSRHVDMFIGHLLGCCWLSTDVRAGE